MPRITAALAFAAACVVSSGAGLGVAASEQTEQAVRRPPPASGSPQRQAIPRRPSPPPRRTLPPRFPGPAPYHFVPISTERGWYYHAYFGFYYGPYYGPYYPYPGPFYAHDNYAALRTRVEPRETRVYVNGYFAGEADDFDGFFQRLYVPAGMHVIEFVLDGYETFVECLYLNVNESRDVRHVMRKLRPGESATEPMSPLPHAVSPSKPVAPVSRPNTPYGVLTLSVEPADAVIEIDGEEWAAPGANQDLVIHLTSGRHDVQVSKAGYQPFRTEIELSEGAGTRLTVRLRR